MGFSPSWGVSKKGSLSDGELLREVDQVYSTLREVEKKGERASELEGFRVDKE